MSELDEHKIPVARVEMKVGAETFGSGWCYVKDQSQLAEHLEDLLGDAIDWDAWGPNAVVTITFEWMDKAAFDALEPWEA